MRTDVSKMQQIPDDTEPINNLLNYWFRTSFPPPEDAPFRSYWFRATTEQDEEMNSLFSLVWTKAVNDESLRARWSSTREGRTALIILLDQLPRNMFRGTAQMFASDVLVLPLALQMVNDDISPVEKSFVYLAIQHAEKLEHAKLAEAGLKELVKNLANEKHQRKFMKLLPSAKAHVKILEQFGRYCHRNDLLGRESTEEEKKFLLTATNNFIKSVKGPKIGSSPTTKKPIHQLPTPIRPMRLLLLHGFRQNSTVIRDALKPMISALRPYPIEFITLNSPMVYRPGTTPFGDSEVSHPTWSQPAEHLRCWWNASDDGKVYSGWESSVRFIERAWIEKGGWDGVIAFSQGATLASLLSSMPQLSCSHARFAVLVSGSPSRATAHQAQFQNKIPGVKTLNIYGLQDEHLGTPEQMKERTLKLAALYDDAVIVEHGGGHFTPQWWPWDTIVKFILDQSLPVEDFSDDDFKDEESKTLEERLEKLVRHWEIHGENGRSLPTFHSPLLREKFGTSAGLSSADTIGSITGGKEENHRKVLFDEFAQIFRGADCAEEQILDDMFILTFFYHPKYAKGLKEGDCFREMLTLIGITAPEYLIQQFPRIVKFGHWRDLNNLVSDNWTFISNPVHGANAKRIHSAILDYMGRQLQRDAAIIADQSNPLSGEEGEDPDFTALSLLALYVPRIKGSLDTATHFARDLAVWLRPASKEKEKLTAYVGYQKLYRSICNVLENTSPDRANYSKGREMEIMPRLTVEERLRILSMPPNLFVTTPEEVPVAPCPIEELQPVINYLSSNAPVPKDNVKFVRGTVVPVKTPMGSKGVVDMCKQVVGPDGIAPLLEGLMMCKGVEGLLLGNNVTGSKGAREIAKCIRREDSQITTWYLGGNQFGPDDIGVISTALEKDKKVLAVWLKRNPVLPAGTMHLAKVLSANRTLMTLDFSNCGLLDEGCISLFRDGMTHNQTMKHLYLNTNGITAVGARVIAKYFENGGSLESLYMSCNPLGDEGARLIADSLKGKTSLVRLGLASCAVGDVGIKALVDMFPTLTNLEYLNLGFLKGTYLFNGLPNYLGLNGMTLLCSVIPQMPSLRYLDINHNQIPPEGLQLLLTTLRSLPEGMGLTSLLCGQFGQQRSELVEDQLKETLSRNKFLWGKMVAGGDCEEEWRRVGEELSLRALCPDHVREIMSTTRNMD